MKNSKIKYVQLDFNAFLTDPDFIKMTPAQRGIYISLILALYSNGGSLKFDNNISKLCGCSYAQFIKIFSKISFKFREKTGNNETSNSDSNSPKDFSRSSNSLREINRGQAAVSGIKNSISQGEPRNSSNDDVILSETKNLRCDSQILRHSLRMTHKCHFEIV